MTDDPTRTALDGKLISVETVKDAHVWMKALGCTEAELRLAVRKVGHSVEDVRACLAKKN